MPPRNNYKNRNRNQNQQNFQQNQQNQPNQPNQQHFQQNNYNNDSNYNYNNNNNNNNNNYNNQPSFNQTNNPHNNQRQKQPQEFQQVKSDRVTVRISNYDTNWDFKTFQRAINSICSERWLGNAFKQGQNSADIFINPRNSQGFVAKINQNGQFHAQILSGGGQNDQNQQGHFQQNNNNYQQNNQQNNPNFQQNNQQNNQQSNFQNQQRSQNNISNALTSMLQIGPDGGVIDLSSLKQTLHSNNVNFNWGDRKCTEELFSWLLQNGAQITKLSLANNNLDFSTQKWMKKIFSYCSKLDTVALNGNQCKDLNSLTSLLNDIKHCLVHLIVDTSVFQLVLQEFSSQYDQRFSQYAVHTWFLDHYPLLSTLNSDKITPFLRLNTQPKRVLSFPDPSTQYIQAPLQNYSNIDQNSFIPVSFALIFINAFDNDRSQLEAVYNNASLFSLSCAKDISNPSQAHLDEWCGATNKLRNGMSQWGSSELVTGQQVCFFELYFLSCIFDFVTFSPTFSHSSFPPPSHPSPLHS